MECLPIWKHLLLKVSKNKFILNLKSMNQCFQCFQPWPVWSQISAQLTQLSQTCQAKKTFLMLSTHSQQALQLELPLNVEFADGVHGLLERLLEVKLCKIFIIKSVSLYAHYSLVKLLALSELHALELLINNSDKVSFLSFLMISSAKKSSVPTKWKFAIWRSTMKLTWNNWSLMNYIKRQN